MTTSLRKTVSNNHALVIVLSGSSIALATTVEPARALYKSDVNHAATLLLIPQKNIAIAQAATLPIQQSFQPST